jgi:hypothetical protein
MGKINVSLLRYLNTEDYRVLTAVSDYLNYKMVRLNKKFNFN